jgi:large subunit ribosomal protein L3
MGDVNVTIKNIEIVDVRPDQNLLFVRGAVPGGVNGLVLIYQAD